MRGENKTQQTTNTPSRAREHAHTRFIKISPSSGVINARARPRVDARVLKVNSRSHSAQPSVKRRPKPITPEGKENAISHSIKKKYYIFLGAIKTSLMEHFWRRGRGGTRTPRAAPALMFTNSRREPPCPARLRSSSRRNKEASIKVTNESAGFIAFSGIICMDFTSLLNNPFTVINKAEIG